MKPADPLELGLEALPAGARQAQPRLQPERAHDELARLPLGLHVQPADQAIAFEQRKDIVAVSAPLLGHEHLDPIVEAEQPGEALAVAQQRIERVQDAKPLLRRRRSCSSSSMSGRASSLRGGAPFAESRVAGTARSAEVARAPGLGLLDRDQAEEARDLAGLATPRRSSAARQAQSISSASPGWCRSAVSGITRSGRS